MTQKEAIDEIIMHVGFVISEIKDHERFEEDEQNEGQIKIYEENKKEVEAYTVVLGSIDPKLSTMDGIYERYLQVNEERYGSSDAGALPEPNETELKLVEILSPWCKKVEQETGFGAEFQLTDEENLELAKINADQGDKHVVIDDDPDDIPEASEDDTFTFYTYRGRVQVIYNDYADGDFCSYPEAFQKKAYEIIKGKIENE